MTENSWKTFRVVAKKRVHMCGHRKQYCILQECEVIGGRSRGGSIGSIEGLFEGLHLVSLRKRNYVHYAPH